MQKNLQDFSDIYKQNSESSSDSDEDQAVGTLNYMAPEIFTDEYRAGPKIDYWSIGVVLFELYTFKVPFEADTQEKIKENILNMNINWEPMMSEEVKKITKIMKQLLI